MSEIKTSYHWLGINKEGKRVNGTLDAFNDRDAQNELEKNGIEVIKLISKKKNKDSYFKSDNIFGKKKIKQKEILLFTRYLSTMLSAGLPITQALEIISHDQDNPSMQGLINSIRASIEGGKTLAEAFNKHPKYFNNLYCNLIKAGERSGTLDKMLIRIALYMERTESLKRKVKKALIYPAAIISVAIIVSLVLLIFVVPQFEKMFKSFGAELPIFTRAVVSVSQFVRDYWWIVIAGTVGGIYLLKYSFERSPAFQYLVNKWSLKLYIIGPIITKSILARFSRTLATTMAAGMPIVDSMRAMSEIMGNQVYKNAVLDICDDVTTGRQLSVLMSTTKLFPNMAIQMVAVGEASGSLEDMLNRIADYYEEEVNTIVDSLSSLLEPVIMLVLGVLIGGFVIAMYIPIFKLGSLF